ncbi:MAG: peptide-methionine (S)-S-oxide reductase MsrA [Roseivirga sp.]|nr:peptide-methionine (S)-S-oxide reductase MsrA [Roseivirga sp.]
MKLRYSVFTILLSLTMFACSQALGQGTDEVDNSKRPAGTEIATFAGGCFWCTEAVFERVIGVKDVFSGYTGGPQEHPTYRQVSYGDTDHAEGIQIYYDPKLVTYKELVEIFFATHDPTQLNRQGPDRGRQYRSAVYYHNAEQKKIVADHMTKLTKSGKYSKDIVTELTAYDKFWVAEKYHQNYYELNPGNGYVINVAVPKVKKFKKYFPEKLKPEYGGGGH